MAGPSNISLKDRTEYLVLRKFPFARAIEFPPSLNASRGQRTEASPQLREALAAYRAELASLPSQEIAARYDAEKLREYQLAVEKARREERERPFNQPRAAADFEHWSKLAHWTLDEAVALSFGKAPELVNWQEISKYMQLSPFAVQYGRRRELALRAAQWKQLYDPVLPGIFLAWAKGLEIEVPAALVEAVQKRGPIRDWKSLYDELKTTHANREASWTALDEAKDRTIVAKDRVVAALEERLRNLEAQQTTQPPEKQLGARERESLLKVVIGMAVGGYSYDPGCVKTRLSQGRAELFSQLPSPKRVAGAIGFDNDEIETEILRASSTSEFSHSLDPKAGRSDRPAEIAGDLERAGVPLDVDTVRKWLREAADLLPPRGND